MAEAWREEQVVRIPMPDAALPSIEVVVRTRGDRPECWVIREGDAGPVMLVHDGLNIVIRCVPATPPAGA